MATAVESPVDSLEHTSEAQRSQNSSESNSKLPNVFITPPEEEFDRPPWCCFDADKDAQPGAFVSEDLETHDFDYAAHAEDEIFGRGATYSMMEDREREDVFVMHSLMQEAETLKEKLKSLDLSAGTFSFTAPLLDEDDGRFDEPVDSPTTTTAAAAATTSTASTTTTVVSTTSTAEKVKRRKSLFSFRRKSVGENRTGVLFPSLSTTDLTCQTSSVQNVDVDSLNSTRSRKASIFSRLKFSSKKPDSESNAVAGRPISAARSQEDMPSPQKQEMVLKRRFSFFGRRPSLSSQRAPTSSAVTSIDPSMNQSNSSLSTSSVPLTPDVGTCNLNSPPSSPTEKSSDRMSIMDTSILSPMNVLAVDNIAASLSLPSSHSVGPDAQFSLDPLHFESLQFNSDDFA